MSEEYAINSSNSNNNNEKIAGQYDAYGESVHGTRVSLRLYVISMAFVATASFIIGGLVLPYLKFKPKVEKEFVAGQSLEENALKVSIGPQTVWASTSDGLEPIATGLSVEQVLSEYEVMASQAGLLTSLEFVRNGDKVEARYAFKERNKSQEVGGIAVKPRADFPRSLVLVFSASPTPGAIVLSEARENGKRKSAGAIFVDLIKMGGVAPELSEGQYLTPRGIFEIRSVENGVAAFIDNAQVFPIKAQNDILSFGKKDIHQANTEANIQILQLRGIEPNNAVFRERFIMVASDVGAADCTSRAIIYDVPRQKAEVLEYMLQRPNLNIGNGKNAIILGGFCEKQNEIAQGPKTDKAAPNYHIDAVYNIQNGSLSYNRVLNQIPSVPVANTLRPAAGWRATSPTRIASPLGNGAALASLSCQPGGGMSLSLAGIPAPADQKSARITFGASNANASAAMRWIPSATSYEINEVGRPQEFRAILQAFRSDGPISISGAGNRASVTSPGRASIDMLRATCGAAPIRITTPNTIGNIAAKTAQPKSTPNSANTSRPNPTPKPKPVASKAQSNIPSFNANSQTAKPRAAAPKPTKSEAQAVGTPKKSKEN